MTTSETPAAPRNTIVGNSEFVRCECGTGEKCGIGSHPYVVIGGVAWCERCNREADLEICRINHVLPNAANEPCSEQELSMIAENRRVSVNCRMPCNNGLIPAFRATDKEVLCPEEACPYNNSGRRFNDKLTGQQKPEKGEAL